MKLKLYYADGGEHPVLGQVYHQCQEVLGGEARYQRYLANTLSGIAQSVEECERILSVVEKIEAGRLAETEVEGNDVDLTISKTSIQVDINVNDDWVGQPEGKFSLEEFKTAVTAWRDFLKLPESFESEVIVKL